MRLATITAATALSLGTVSIPTVGIADCEAINLDTVTFIITRRLSFPMQTTTTNIRLMRQVITRPLASCRHHPRRRANAIATSRHLPSPQKVEALGKSRS